MKFPLCMKRLHNPIMFHNYDYYFIIKRLEKEFQGHDECLGGNTEKCITFFHQSKKKLKTARQ